MKRAAGLNAGTGSLNRAALLAKEGLEVAVFEARIFPGCCTSSPYQREHPLDAGVMHSAGYYSGNQLEPIGKAARECFNPTDRPVKSKRGLQPVIIVLETFHG